MRPTLCICVFAALLASACQVDPAEPESTGSTVYQGLDGGADGSADGSVESGADAENQADAAAPEEEGRATEGLIAEWHFESPEATVVAAAGDTRLSLEQRPDPEVTDGTPADMLTDRGGGVRVNTGGYYLDALPAEVFARLTDRDGFALEVWVSPDNRTQTGPARIFTISADSAQRNVTLGQQNDEWVARFRHVNGDLDPDDTEPFNNGTPALYGPMGNAAQTHLVVSYDGYFLSIWEDGREIANVARPDGVANWDPTYGLALMNEFVASRQFVGTLYLAALWDHGIDGRTIRRNFFAGPRGQQ